MFLDFCLKRVHPLSAAQVFFMIITSVLCAHDLNVSFYVEGMHCISVSLSLIILRRSRIHVRLAGVVLVF